mgnify:CR=1 FL=1
MRNTQAFMGKFVFFFLFRFRFQSVIFCLKTEIEIDVLTSLKHRENSMDLISQNFLYDPPFSGFGYPCFFLEKCLKSSNNFELFVRILCVWETQQTLTETCK